MIITTLHLVASSCRHVKQGTNCTGVIFSQVINASQHRCGSVQNNIWRSPGYPSNYPSNVHCVYRVRIPLKKGLLISFNYLSLESHSRCGYDYLRITVDKSKTNGRYCGDQTGKSVLVYGTVAVLTFHTDGSVQGRGYELYFSFVPKTLACRSVQNNILRSPVYPSNYPNNVDCVNQVFIPLNTGLLVSFNYFSLESHSRCAYDYLRITDGSGNPIGTYCGYQTGKSVRIVGTTVAVLIFHTDASAQGRGFELSFSFFRQSPTTSATTYATKTIATGTSTSTTMSSVTVTPIKSSNGISTLNTSTTTFEPNSSSVTPKHPFTPQTYSPYPTVPSEIAMEESIVLWVTGLDVRKWHQGVEENFKAEVARLATKYCNIYQAKCVSNTTSSHQWRPSDMVFSRNMVLILPGYPKQSPEDPKVTMVAFYLSLPPKVSQVTVVPKDTLTIIVGSNIPSIGRSMDSFIVSVKPLSLPTKESQTNHYKNNQPGANHTAAIVGGVVGGCLFLVVVVVLLRAYVRRKRPWCYSSLFHNLPKDSIQAIGKEVDSTFEMKKGVYAPFSNATDAELSQSKNLDLSGFDDHPKSFENPFTRNP